MYIDVLLAEQQFTQQNQLVVQTIELVAARRQLGIAGVLCFGCEVNCGDATSKSILMRTPIKKRTLVL
jgi:hypothetical protein